ncbi:hypothetical protein JCM3770_005450 [Rhodotorula araucariae]
MPTKANNGYSVPTPALAEGFEWQNTFEDLLEQIASTNVVDADWSILKDMIKYKLSEAIASFLTMGPPWPLPPDDAVQARARAYDTLDSFQGPPFTIQRLCELALYPRRQYTSLPKYLRAVSRILSVTSERSAFAEEDDGAQFASTSAITLDTSLGIVHRGVVISPAHTPSSPIATRRPTPSPSPSPSASPRSSPQVVPLLSPIPWLRKGDPSSSSASSGAHSENGDVESLHLGSPPPPAHSPRLPTVSLPAAGASPGSATDPHISPPKRLQQPETATPTGGLVDEVDPGSGGQETAAPVALSSATTLASPPEGERGTGDGGDAQEKSATLQERFVRASSPRVEVPLPDEHAGAGGEGDAMATDP